MDPKNEHCKGMIASYMVIPLPVASNILLYDTSPEPFFMRWQI